jgi:ferredoxin-thioredoxin reductase catalytic subunit
MTTLEKVRQRAQIDARTHGYYLNPDSSFLQDLLEGLKLNEKRYGYPSCPCRAATGNFELDRDIICPCDYRDPDVQEFGACYCALYVDRGIYEGEKEVGPIPERRPMEKQLRSLGVAAEKVESKVKEERIEKDLEETGRVLHYCKQCGYLAFREEPPYVCPICRAPRERFAEIKTSIEFFSK